MEKFIYQRDPRFVLFGLDERAASWRGVGLLAAVFFGSLLIAALLTPPTYWLVEVWHNQTHSETAKWLLDKGVDVYFDRWRMVSIVLALPWLMSQCHLWSWRALGLSLERINLNRFALNWLGGFTLIFGLAMVRNTHMASGIADHARFFQASLTALLAGLMLGFLEETIFRGMILRIFYTATRRPWLALVIMAAFFAYTHFKVPTNVATVEGPGFHWPLSLVVAFDTAFGIFLSFNALQFLVLWLLGMVLGALTLRTGSLLPGIGLHAGIVTAMTYYRGSNLTNNWAAATALAVVFVLVVFWPNHQRSTPKV